MKLSTSLIKTYKMCRRKYELKYIEELEPVVKAQALQDGSDYHQLIEDFYKGEPESFNPDENPKICSMAMAYAHYIAPNLPNIKSVEKWFEYKLTRKHSIVGRCDAIASDGIPIEHKTVSGDIDEEYVYALQWDEQILTYMLANDINEMYYTVVKKPTIRQKQNETGIEFYQRCCIWYKEDTDSKVRLIKVTRSKQEIAEHKKNLVVLANEIEKCKHFYRNPCSCTCYNRRCEYSQVCLNYNPQLDYVEFEKRKRYSEVVKENGLF